MKILISSFKDMDRSAEVLMGYNAPKEDYENMAVVIRTARESFSRFCLVDAEVAVTIAARAIAGDETGFIIDDAAKGAEAKRVELFNINDTQRPTYTLHITFPIMRPDT